MLLLGENDFLVAKCEAVAAVANIKLQKKVGDAKAGSPKDRLGIYPNLETPQGVLSGSNAICLYLARGNAHLNLCGCSVFQEAEIVAIMENFSNEFEVPAAVLAKDSKNAKAKMACKKYLTRLNNRLQTQTFAVGERLTYADIAISVVIKKTDVDLTAFPNVARLVGTICGRPLMGKIFGASGKKQPKEPQAKEQVKKENTPPAEETVEKPPAEKPPAEKKPTVELPPTKLDAEEWKRYYSNSKDKRGDAMPWMWERVDDGWSFWRMEYDKMEGECEKDYVTRNLLNGFLQALEPSMRKVSFGNFAVVGEEGNYDCQGVWMFRGQEIAQPMQEHRSFEYYKFNKIDHSTAEGKKMIEDYFLVDDEFVEGHGILEGRPCVAYVCFK